MDYNARVIASEYWLDPDRGLGDPNPDEDVCDTDPYHHLEWVVGSGDDFVCFDYCFYEEYGTVKLHAVLNSETGSFIQNFSDPQTVAVQVAVTSAQEMVGEAITWCAENGVEHDEEGWNQDPMYFARCVEREVTGGKYPTLRKVSDG